MENEEFHFPTIDVRKTGERIREQRKARHITVRRIQDCMGFREPQAIYKWQRGDSLPSLDNIIALAKLFHTTMEDILVINDDEDVLPRFGEMFPSRKLHFTIIRNSQSAVPYRLSAVLEFYRSLWYPLLVINGGL